MENRQLLPAHFGELLKMYRKRQQMTQKQLAQSLGIGAKALPNRQGVMVEPEQIAALRARLAVQRVENRNP